MRKERKKKGKNRERGKKGVECKFNERYISFNKTFKDLGQQILISLSGKKNMGYLLKHIYSDKKYI